MDAAEKIFNLLPVDIRDYFLALWNEFEENKTNNAKFAHALDKLQGFTQQVIAEGRTWQEEGIFK